MCWLPVTTICLWLAHITFGYDIHVTVIPAYDICLSHLLLTSACHSCWWHLPVTLWYANNSCLSLLPDCKGRTSYLVMEFMYLSYLLMTSACHTCWWHLTTYDNCISLLSVCDKCTSHLVMTSAGRTCLCQLNVISASDTCMFLIHLTSACHIYFWHLHGTSGC